MKTLLGSASLLLVLVTSCANNTPATCDTPSCRQDCISLGWVSGRCEDGVCRCTNEGFACGDGVIDPGEACDDGSRNSDTRPDACRTNCAAPRCGDRVVDTGEACDDGNVVDGDSCRPNCTLPGCGDGVVQTGEDCDDGNADDTDACLSTCRPAACGDGTIWAGHETCEGSAMQSCMTSCGTTGSQSCMDCSWPTTCTPPADTCNGIDDDCDTLVDEGCAADADADVGDDGARADDARVDDGARADDVRVDDGARADDAGVDDAGGSDGTPEASDVAKSGCDPLICFMGCGGACSIGGECVCNEAAP